MAIDAFYPRLVARNDDGEYYVVGHADFEEPLDNLPHVHLIPDWANLHKYDTLPLTWHMSHCGEYYLLLSSATGAIPVIVSHQVSILNHLLPCFAEIAFGCLERLPAGELSPRIIDAISTIRTNLVGFYEVSQFVQYEYMPKRGTKGNKVHKRDFDSCLIGIGVLTKALEEVMEVPAEVGHFNLPSTLEHLLETRGDYRDGEYCDWLSCPS